MACSADTGASSVMLRNDCSIRNGVLPLPFGEHRYNFAGYWSYFGDINAKDTAQLVFPSSKDSSVLSRICICKIVLSKALLDAQLQKKSL